MVAGVDEAGWGALAGPVSVGVAVVPNDEERIPQGLRDSKAFKKRECKRETIFYKVVKWCNAWAVGHATHAECDRLGASEARVLAACRAMGALGVKPHYILVDGDQDFVGGDNTCLLRKGDERLASIAAASILAKVVRDRIMHDLSREFGDYGFESNKGYYGHSTSHKDALRDHGPSRIHRRRTKVLKSLPSPLEPGLDLAGYSRLSRPWVDPDGVTRPSTLTG